ncbi:hypothetical protein BDR04DRAFT_1107149 [Suillus decipiens]|nr:hypothetical protein BDR04DRAFT_1107149 [Suillus decipiens]
MAAYQSWTSYSRSWTLWNSISPTIATAFTIVLGSRRRVLRGRAKKGNLRRRSSAYLQAREILDWFRPPCNSICTDTFSDEMNMVKQTLHGTLDSVTPEFLLTWDLNSTMQNVVVSKAPVLRHILRR